jgi:hypothetical protein
MRRRAISFRRLAEEVATVMILRSPPRMPARVLLSDDLCAFGAPNR